MNLSPSWVEQLSRHGFEAVHWSTVGPPTGRDEEILGWVRAHDFMLLTHDLDFAAVLAAAGELSPSIVQIRMQDVVSDKVVEEAQTVIELWTTTRTAICRVIRAGLVANPRRG
jgi:predicted nuclease of predicted toxin-antitoxin system